MNIFASHRGPSISALWLDDLRLNKMILESAQMLSTAIRVLTDDDPEICEGLYKKTHPNHPCNIWVRESSGNFWWLIAHSCTMANHKAIMGKRHKSHAIINAAQNAHFHHNIIPEGDTTPFVNAAANKSLGLDFKHIEDPHLAYREYLTTRWLMDKRMPKWTGDARACPDWALDKLRAKYGEDQIPETTYHVWDHKSYRLMTERERWAEGKGNSDDIYACIQDVEVC